MKVVCIFPPLAGARIDAVDAMLRESCEDCGRVAAGLEPEGRVW